MIYLKEEEEEGKEEGGEISLQSLSPRGAEAFMQRDTLALESGAQIKP